MDVTLYEEFPRQKRCLVHGEQTAVQCGSPGLTIERGDRHKDTTSDTKEHEEPRHILNLQKIRSSAMQVQTSIRCDKLEET